LLQIIQTRLIEHRNMWKLDLLQFLYTSACSCTFLFPVELVLKVRIQNPNLRENDFIEIELDRQELTYKELLRVSCHELGVNPEHVQKIRKLPNTMLRKVRTLNVEVQ